MPKLKTVAASLGEIPEAARTFYVEKDGKFILDLDGTPSGFALATDLAEANGKVVEFRDSNVALLKEVTDLRPLKEKYKDLDPEAARTAMARVAELEKKGVKGADDFDQKIKAAITAAVQPIADELKAAKTAGAEAQQRADGALLRQAVGDKFIKAGGRASALDFIVGRAGDVFKVDNGVVIAQPNKFSADKPGEALGVDEWLTKQATEADFAFEPSKGGGAEGNKGAQSNGNPNAKQLLNPSPQDLGKFAKEIASGEMVVVNTAAA